MIFVTIFLYSERRNLKDDCQCGGGRRTYANYGWLDFTPFYHGQVKEILLRIIAGFEKWEAVFSVNIHGVIFCYKYAAKQMVKQGTGGRIIGQYMIFNCSSV